MVVAVKKRSKAKALPWKKSAPVEGQSVELLSLKDQEFRVTKYRGRFRGKAVYFWKLEVLSGKHVMGTFRYMHRSVLNQKVRELVKNAT